MSDDLNSSSSSKSTEFVDIHGRDISVLIGEHGDILVPLDEIKKTGFSIFKKSQHNKLMISDRQFNDEFNLYMLEAAKSYMLSNRIFFQPEDVLRTIDNCKKLLTGGNKTPVVKTSPPKPRNVIEERFVVENGNDDFKVQVNQEQERVEKQRTLSFKNLQEHNKNNNRDNSENGISQSPSAWIRSPHTNIFKQKWNNRNEKQPESSENGNIKCLGVMQSPQESTFKPKFNNRYETLPESLKNLHIKSSGAMKSPHENTFKQKWNNRNETAPESSEHGNFRSPGAMKSPPDNTFKQKWNNRNETAPESSEHGNFRSPGGVRSPSENTFKQKWNNRNETSSESFENGVKSPPGPSKSPFNTYKPKYNNQNETIPKKNQEYQNIPEKLPSVQLNDVHIVTVTHQEKENIIWARDKKYDDLLEAIYNEVFEDAKKQNYTHNFQLNSLYLAQDNNEWYRCKIVRFKPLTVSFVDYGNIVETDRIKTISEELTRHPCLANRMSFRGLPPAVGMEIEIKVVKCWEDGTYSVSILNRIAAQKATPPKTPTLKPVSAPVNEENSVEFNIRPKLTHGERVTIICEENGIFYLRNQKGYINLNTINEQIKNTKLIPVSNPRVKDMVLCKKRNQSNEFTYCRGVINSFDDELAEIDFIDYNGTCLSSLDSLMQAPRCLSAIEGTFLTLHQLLGCDKPFTAAQRNYIENKIKSRQKYTVTLVGCNFDLEDHVCSLSKQLLDLEIPDRKEEVVSNNKKTSNVLMLNDIEVYQPKLGMSGYMCTHFKNFDNVSFVSSEALEENIGNVLFTETEDSKPYEPIVGEVCLGQYNDSWNRCAVSRVVGDKFEVVFIDFGNVEIKSPTELRKAGPVCKISPVLSFPCQLVDFPRTQKAEAILKELIVENDIYNVEVKAFKNGKYEILVPSAYDKLRAAL